MDLSKKDKLYKDAMETAAESKSPEIAENLLVYFIAEKRNDSFTACLYKCYELLRADVVMELSWRHGLNDFAMPYLIQVARQTLDKLKVLEDADSSRSTKEHEKAKQGILMSLDRFCRFGEWNGRTADDRLWRPTTNDAGPRPRPGTADVQWSGWWLSAEWRVKLLINHCKGFCHVGSHVKARPELRNRGK